MLLQSQQQLQSQLSFFVKGGGGVWSLDTQRNIQIHAWTANKTQSNWDGIIASSNFLLKKQEKEIEQHNNEKMFLFMQKIGEMTYH